MLNVDNKMTRARLDIKDGHRQKKKEQEKNKTKDPNEII
jgi:hypothetical protein